MALTYRRVHHLRLHRQRPGSPPLPGPRPLSTHTPAPAPGLVIDPDARTVTVDGRRLDLPFLQFELLTHLVKHPRRVHSRTQLMNTVWGRPATGGLRTIDAHIARLRRALGTAHAATITTVHRVGYAYRPDLALSDTA
jgi:DNA-binding response OmpR family regulator